MRLRVWELLLGAFAVFTGVMYLLAGVLFIGILGVGLGVLFVLARAVLIENHRAGSYALGRGKIESVQSVVVFLIVIAAVGTSLAASWAGWARDLRGQVAIYALVGLEVFALLDLTRRGSSAVDHLVGGRAEAIVGAELARLPDNWFVLSNLRKDWGGNVDHVVCGPGGAYVIETKSGHYSGKAGGQAEANARFVRFKLRRNWVVPIVCVGQEQEPIKKGQVWVMSPPHLHDWLFARRDQAIEADTAAAALHPA